jgi:hypothetical protein
MPLSREIEAIPNLPARHFVSMKAQRLNPWSPVLLARAAWQWIAVHLRETAKLS